MKKFKLGISFLLLVILSLCTENFLGLINYLSALSIHELSHIFVASKRGYKLQKCKLDMFGLQVELDDSISDNDSFAINLAGPLTNLFLVLVCLASFYLIPASFPILNNFCIANLVLAIFNLLPLRPLDGGKICFSLFKNKSKYKLFDKIVKLILIILSSMVFVYSCIIKQTNLFFVIFILFVLSCKEEKPTFSLIKYRKPKAFESVEIIKIGREITLIDMIKKIKKSRYTIFFCLEINKHYIDEDSVIDLTLIYPLDTKLSTIKEFN